MRIYSKNGPAKFHRDPIWNDGALGFFEEGRPNKNKNKNSSDVRSVTDPTRSSVRDIDLLKFSTVSNTRAIVCVSVSKNSRSRSLRLVFFRCVLWLNDTSYSKSVWTRTNSTNYWIKNDCKTLYILQFFQLFIILYMIWYYIILYSIYYEDRSQGRPTLKTCLLGTCWYNF